MSFPFLSGENALTRGIFCQLQLAEESFQLVTNITMDCLLGVGKWATRHRRGWGADQEIQRAPLPVIWLALNTNLIQDTAKA